MMAGGWSRDGDVQQQIDATVNDAVSRARSAIPNGESAVECNECGQDIPAARREALPGVRFCVSCQTTRDAQAAAFTGYNRRGSKDSQLR